MTEKSNLVPLTARRRKYGLDCSGEPSLTKQTFKDQCDINRVLDRAKTGAGLSHLANYGGLYGDFSNWDERTYEDMQAQMAQGISIFNDLPAELRQEFDNNPGKFFGFVNDPANKDRLEEIFPVLSQPGLQFPDVLGTIANTVQQAVAAASTNTAPPEGANTTETTDTSQQTQTGP